MMIEENDYLKALKIIKTYRAQMKKPLIEDKTKGGYTEHYLDWRNKYYDVSINIQQWQSKATRTRYTTNKLHKLYKMAMLESPFKKFR